MPIVTTTTRTGPALIPPADAAEILGVTAATLNIWRCTKRYPLPYIKIGRKVMYRLSDVEAFIDAGTVGGNAERN
jgi:hypothetical protein